MEKNKYHTNILKTYLIATTAGFTYIYTIINVLFLQVFSLSYTYISILALATSLTVLICEIPTGAFADLYGRKKSLLIGYMFFIAGILLFCFTSHFMFFFIASICFGLSMAFSSGSWQAIIYDSLQALKREKEYLK